MRSERQNGAVLGGPKPQVPTWEAIRPTGPRQPLAMSQPDGVLHRLGADGWPLCGTMRDCKLVRTDSIPATVPQCPECLARVGVPRPRLAAILARQSWARRAVMEVVRCH